jgi:hypothetical protein
MSVAKNVAKPHAHVMRMSPMYIIFHTPASSDTSTIVRPTDTTSVQCGGAACQKKFEGTRTVKMRNSVQMVSCARVSWRGSRGKGLRAHSRRAR